MRRPRGTALSDDEGTKLRSRRAALAGGALLGFLLPLLAPLLDRFLPPGSRLRRILRPPGALEESAFLQRCIGCAQCANVCPNQCIRLFGPETGVGNLGTPKITARSKACILCMACTQVCPTGALRPLEPTPEGKRAAGMGKAVVSTEVCYSYSGRTCGVCYRACPLPGEAMSLGLMETPLVNADACVGCGLCEQACVHMPQAIRIIPTAEIAENGGALPRKPPPKPPSPFAPDETG